jgi:hypothetical protein
MITPRTSIAMQPPKRLAGICAFILIIVVILPS